MNSRKAAFAFACLTLALVVWKVAHAAWPLTSFQVVAREPTAQELVRPTESMIDSIASRIGFADSAAEPSGPEQEIPKAAQWLQEMSQRYSATGHRTPALEPVLEIGGQKRYRAYMFAFDGSRTRDATTAEATYESNTIACSTNGKIAWLAVNNRGAATNLPAMTYHAFAHEMMHAIQWNSPLTGQCTNDPFWITEGMANGASGILMNGRDAREISHRDKGSSAVGLRSYRIPLTHTSGQAKKTMLDLRMGYGASSLWQFIGERLGGIKVYPHFLDKVMIRNMDSAEQMKWFDERLQSLEGLADAVSASSRRRVPKQPPGFYEVFPAFLAEFASYGGSRYWAFAGRKYPDAEAARDVWLEKAFGGCHLIELSPETRTREIPFSVFKNAAICLHLKYENFSGNVSTKMEIISTNLTETDAFHLGWAWKIGPQEKDTRSCYEERQRVNGKWPPCVYKTFTQTFPPSKAYARTWPEETIDFGPGGGASAERFLILANAAVQPWRSKNTQTLKLKVAVSGATLNGQPAEPIERMMVPRKRMNMPNPARPIGKEELYGLQTDPPQAQEPVKGLRLGPYTPNRNKGAKVLPGGYGVVFYGVEYEKTGPVTGLIKREPDGSGAARFVSSGLCADPSKPIGEILQSDEKALRIKLSSDLCEAAPGSLQQCEGGCPVVDHVEAEVHVAFGWRQFGATAPTDIRTPGIERYIETMPESLQEALSFGAGTALPDDGNVATGAAASGTSSAGGGTLSEPCACTCQEYEATQAAGRAMRARIAAGGEASMRDLSLLNRCQATCQNDYLLCAFQADQAAKAEREREQHAAQQQAAADCDCSCPGIDRIVARGKEIEAQFAGGGQVPMAELAALTRCSQACQQEMLNCATQQ